MNIEDKINFILDVAKNNHGHIGIPQEIKYHILGELYTGRDINIHFDGVINSFYMINRYGLWYNRISNLQTSPIGFLYAVCDEILNNRYL